MIFQGCDTKNCKFCTEQTCFQCLPGFYLRIDKETQQTQCVECQSNCLKCFLKSQADQTQVCKECSNYYQKDQQNPAICVSNQSSCQAEYYYDLESQMCSKCLDGCLDCNNNETCTQCDILFDYSLSQHNQQCTQMSIQNMIDQNNSNPQCESGQYYNSTQQECQMCQDSCLSCTNSSNCLQCADEYILIRHNNTDNMTNSTQCISKKQICPTGTYYNISQGQCTYCSIQQCSECSDSQICTKCQSEQFVLMDGFCVDQCIDQSSSSNQTKYWNNETKLCENCPENCKYCEKFGTCSQCIDNCDYCLNGDHCGQCKDNFYLEFSTSGLTEEQSIQKNNTKCQACPDTNCQSCYQSFYSSNSSQVYCIMCKVGYVTDLNSSQCVKAPRAVGNAIKRDVRTVQLIMVAKVVYLDTHITQQQRAANQCVLNKNFMTIPLAHAQVVVTRAVSLVKVKTLVQLVKVDTLSIITGFQRIINVQSAKIIAFHVHLQMMLTQQKLFQSANNVKKIQGLINTIILVRQINDGSQTLVNGYCYDTCQLQMINNNLSKPLFFDPISNSCKNCSQENCANCNYDQDTQSDKCLNCSFGYELSSDKQLCQAINCEQPGVYKDGELCDYCAIGCQECSGKYNCTQCMNNMNKTFGQCFENCLQTQFYDYNTQTCNDCIDNCTYCNKSTGRCINCGPYFTLINSTDGNQVCKSCPSGCQYCSMNQLTDMDASPQCLFCDYDKNLNDNGECVSKYTCPSNQFYDQYCGECKPCQEGCQGCQGQRTNCLSCEKDYEFINGTCKKRCKQNQYSDSDSNCQDCSSGCLSCNQSDNCGQCFEGYTLIYDQNAINSSIKTKYIEGAQCNQCPNNCLKCFKENESATIQCAACQNGFKLEENQCKEQSCQTGQYYDSKFETCIQCPENCTSCTSLTQCTQCSNSQLEISNGACKDKCLIKSQAEGKQYFYNATTQGCDTCEETNCAYCNGPKNCQYCIQGYLMNNESKCVKCMDNCQNCSPNDLSTCLTCKMGYKYNNQTQTCDKIDCSLSNTYKLDNNYTNSNEELCEFCQDGCLNCSSKMHCYQCGPLYSLVSDSYCTPNCPERNFFNYSTKSCDSCQQNCHTCATNSYCFECNLGFFLNITNVVNESDTSQNSTQLRTCDACPENCQTCEKNGSSNSLQCLTCALNSQLNTTDQKCYVTNPISTLRNLQGLNTTQNSTQNNTQNQTGNSTQLNNTNTTCSTGFYFNNSLNQCIQCMNNCSDCSQFGCYSCMKNYYMRSVYDPDTLTQKQACIYEQQKNCSLGQYKEDRNNSCRQCPKGCNTCINDKVCMSCKFGFLAIPNANGYINCEQTCPLGMAAIFENEQSRCQKCDQGCLSCDMNGCLECQSNLTLITDKNKISKCVQNCPIGTFKDALKRICLGKFKSMLNIIRL
ncbi:proprotein convertase subtilisin kexin type 5 [Stylonychia lemnae]|uniref:Proprotein convertase subtilisin kexin type 5 n=1 Tax=Stylonychia lemnae TaxID=5949 RepID=A0A077ZVW4_STYLE|nr:proprotein convertase subtilisin kexin type 5 [Stylonychia lemnae]|eukprot:CDW74014.1 proprotein convertase subtilisin kexin type 5 [Stylonychia lemnae]